MKDVIGAITLGIVASALKSHVKHALQRGWALPQQLAEPEVSH